jgi:hypothetical protein
MRYFVHSGFTNAWSLQKGLAKLGRRLDCAAAQAVLLSVTEDQPVAGDVLFFTDERRLKQYLGNTEFQFLPHHPGVLIDDKLELGRWLQLIDEEPVPFWEQIDAPPVWPILLKARHSWLETRKLPQGYLCRSPLELKRALSHIDADGIPRGCFFLQQWISGTRHNLSTCGFYDVTDPERTVIKVARRVLASAGEVGTAAIVETIDDPADLIARTENILERMDFVGPFELEFLYDEAQGRYYVLELNPRFWMQHGLFVDAFDNRVIKNYLDHLGLLEREEPGTADVPAEHAVWLSSLDAMRLLFRGDLRALGAFAGAIRQARRRRARVCWYPDWMTACRFVLKSLCQRRSRTHDEIQAAPPQHSEDRAA